MSIEKQLVKRLTNEIASLYGVESTDGLAQLQRTRKEFEGDYTLVTFPLLKISRKSPEQTAQQLGEYLMSCMRELESFNVIKGFLNLKLKPSFWLTQFNQLYANPDFGFAEPSGKTVMVEYSSPNTNKPLHLGHIRNNLLGYSVALILEANGHRVIKVNLVNDRGVHICKSMLAWLKFGNGETPEFTSKKGDHLVGEYYVRFDRKYSEQIARFKNNLLNGLKQNHKNKIFKEYEKNTIKNITQNIHEELKKYSLKENLNVLSDIAPFIDKECGEMEELARGIKVYFIDWKKRSLLYKAQELLRKWEARDEETINLWKKMNGWVYQGFDDTYRALGVEFDKIYYESETYLLGKSLVGKGLEQGVFFQKEDGSVWIDLEADGLDQKLLLRSDGTSVYMTQDLGTAHQRFTEYQLDEQIYVVGNEQNYHFQVLKLVLKKLGFAWADSIYHLSYGMVELPEGKMKSREGTVVDADDLIEGMVTEARAMSQDLGKLDGLTEKEADSVSRLVAMGALKYFILKVDPKKTMLFDPKESIDFNGNTGPFIQYTHARIRSVIRKAEEQGIVIPEQLPTVVMNAKEVELVKLLEDFPEIVAQAGRDLSPALLANYSFELAKEFNQFYHDYSILREENAEVRQLRLMLSVQVASTIRKAMGLLGIIVPERM